jgi:hypothetical protein
MNKFEHNCKQASAMQPAFVPAMFIDYRPEQNPCGALIM